MDPASDRIDAGVNPGGHVPPLACGAPGSLEDELAELLCGALVRLEAGRPSPADLALCERLVTVGGLDPAQVARFPPHWQPVLQGVLSVARSGESASPADLAETGGLPPTPPSHLPEES